jgi:alkanesulfonate monooxygenase SsuD/methylene tetrahydromethanopterin reductase-like flavin-dependent oxidoreductase (luciferase family)
LHDIKELDSRGIPGGYIASEVFRTAAQTQGDAVGFHPDSLFVAHPIQDRTDDEMRALADRAFEKVLALVSKVP